MTAQIQLSYAAKKQERSKTMMKEYVVEVTEEELEQATGAGSGWFKTITDDCPNSIVICC